MLECEICKKEFLNKGSLVVHQNACKKIFENIDEIRKLYIEEFWSLKQISKKFGVGKGTISSLIRDSIRSSSEANIIAHKKYPDSFKHTDDTKKFLSFKRLEFLKNNPDKTAWRTKNISYPEKIFLEKVHSLSWEKKYSIIREFSVFPFFIDFAFINEMVAVEIDGSQHLQTERLERDKKKDELLIKKGWSVIRISEKEIKRNIEETFEKLEEILLSLSKEKKYEFGVLTLPKIKEKKEREKNGLTQSEYDRIKKSRKVERPSYEELLKLVDEIGFLATGKKYGVSDNAIRKWLRFYLKYEKLNGS